MKAARFPTTTARAICLFCLGTVSANLVSCAHLNDEIAKDPFLTAAPLATSDESPPLDKTPKADIGEAKTIAGIPLPMNSQEGPVVANHLGVRSVKTQPPVSPPPPAIKDPKISNVSGQFEFCPPGAFPVEICPPGYPVLGIAACPPVVPAWFGGAAIAPSPRNFPDEYLCDGGDRGYPVRYDADMRLGLETEDTIAEYTDDAGKSHVKPTNKVCVYAPRFGAMRSISSPVLDTAVNKISSADKFLRGAGMRNRDVTDTNVQNAVLGNYRVRERLSGIDTDARPSAVDQTQTLALNVKLINTFQDLQFIRGGLLTQTDEVRLAKGIQGAVAWTRNQFPVIAAQTEQSQEVSSEFRAQEIVGKESKSKPGRLRIVKLADKDIAQPGEIITFTIRYDNLGERPLSQIRIIDNLTPRLQYVEDSETSDRAGNLVLQDNEEGSLILEFHLDDPLPGGQGGVVTFQTKVR